MAEKTIFPREEKADVLFNKILNDPWACEKLQGTFCNSLFCNEDNNFPLSPAEFSQALFNAYHNRDLSAFLMAICQNTLFDLLRNSFLIPYRFNADGRTNPIIMTDESGNLLPGYKTTVHEKDYQHFYDVYCDLDNKKNIYFAQAYRYRHAYASEKMDMEQQILEKNGNREEWELEHWCETADAENKQFCSGDRKEPAEGEMAALTEQYETAQSAWKDACLFWYDIWCESHQEPEPFSTDGPGTSDFKQAEAQD